jgi:hypothetical protein
MNSIISLGGHLSEEGAYTNRSHPVGCETLFEGEAPLIAEWVSTAI